jgi:hypothetical protein
VFVTGISSASIRVLAIATSSALPTLTHEETNHYMTISPLFDLGASAYDALRSPAISPCSR